MPDFTWEQAVQWLRQQPGQESWARNCYFDDPLIEAARRFADSEEWKAVKAFLPKLQKGRALDLGAGRGISSYALARDGWQVVALELDPSPVVGIGAILELVRESGAPISAIKGDAGVLPFNDGTFDLAYGRQVLHHACDLPSLCREVARVLKPGGRFVATREHVISKPEDLNIFLNSHPLHRFYGGENAYLLSQYVSAISKGGLRVRKTLGPFDSAINYFPMTHDEWLVRCRKPLSRIMGHRLALFFTSEQHKMGRWLLGWLSFGLSKLTVAPGRLYSFIADRPLI